MSESRKFTRENNSKSVQNVNFFIFFSRKTTAFKGWLVGYRYESNCPLVGRGTIGGVPSVGGGSFLGILARIYASFGENHGKLRTVRSISGV